MNPFKSIDIHAAKNLIDSQTVTIVDIRDPGAYSQAHISNAVSVNDRNIEEFLQKTPKDRPLLCYCYHGVSSRHAAGFFQSRGFQEVYSLDGGFEEWRQAYPVV